MAASGTGSWSLFADMLRRGVDTFASYEKMLLDVAAHQNAAWLGWVEESLTRQVTPGMLDLAARTTHSFLESQRIVLDLAVQQSRSGLTLWGIMSDRSESFQEFRDMLEQTAAAFVTAQKRLLDLAGEQADVILKTAQDASANGANSLAQMARLSRQAIDGFSAKQFLDRMSQQTAAASETFQEHFEALYSSTSSREFLDQARQAFHNYIALQMELTGKAAHLMEDWSRAWESGAAFESNVTFEDLARSGMEAFVRTQQQLLEFAFQSLRRG